MNDKEAAYERLAALLEDVLSNGTWATSDPDDSVSDADLNDAIGQVIDLLRAGEA